MKKKKLMVIFILIGLIIIITVSSIFAINKKNKENAKQALIEFVNLINDRKYDEMYNRIETINMSKEDFIARNKNIYEGIDSSNIKVEISEIEQKANEYHLIYLEKMYTAAGEVKFSNNVTIVKNNKDYKLKWSSQFIYPQLGDNQKVRISSIKAKRGDILDRNGQKLATDGTILSVGIVPRKIRRK